MQTKKVGANGVNMSLVPFRRWPAAFFTREQWPTETVQTQAQAAMPLVSPEN